MRFVWKPAQTPALEAMTLSSDYAVVANAIGFLDANHRAQPSLDDLAEELGMSVSHLQRLFTRWAGVSPKRFLQALTLEHSKTLLRESRSLLDTALETGLSGPARLHDLFVTAEGVTPGEFKKWGGSLSIIYGIHQTPFGPALFARTKRGLCHLAFLEADSSDAAHGGVLALKREWPGATFAEAPEDTSVLARVIFPALDQAGPPRQPLSLFLKGTNFQLKVWNALLRIPLGTLTTYGNLAKALGRPGSARAVGSAVARNHIAFLIPCHRVIRETGALGGYRWGGVRKRAILGWEASRNAS